MQVGLQIRAATNICSVRIFARYFDIRMYFYYPDIHLMFAQHVQKFNTCIYNCNKMAAGEVSCSVLPAFYTCRVLKGCLKNFGMYNIAIGYSKMVS